MKSLDLPDTLQSSMGRRSDVERPPDFDPNDEQNFHSLPPPPASSSGGSRSAKRRDRGSPSSGRSLASVPDGRPVDDDDCNDDLSLPMSDEGNCLPPSADDVRMGNGGDRSVDSSDLPLDGAKVLPVDGSGDADNTSRADNDDGNCLPFSSEDVHFDAKGGTNSLTKPPPSPDKGCCGTTRRCRLLGGVILLTVTALAVGLGVGLSKTGQQAVYSAQDWAAKYLSAEFPDATLDTGGKRDDIDDRGTITFTSPSFQYGEPIPIRYTADAGNVSPPLDWSSLPEGTQDVVVLCEDVDFPHPDHPASEPYVHWVAYGISSAWGNLPENLPKNKEVDNLKGTDPATGEVYEVSSLFQGVTSDGVSIEQPSDPLDAGRPVGWGYHGPDPTAGHPPHRYYFRLLALDGRVVDHFPSDGLVVTAKEVKALLGGADPKLNVLGTGVMMGTYQKA